MQREPPVDGAKYERFTAMWFALYREVEEQINRRLNEEYPYSVRVFDKILWIIGQPDYGLIPYGAEGGGM